MNESNRIKLISIALVLLSIQLIGPSSANADSPRSWGYWNAGPAAGTGTTGSGGVDINTNNLDTVETNNSGNSVNDEQNVSRLNRGLTAASPKETALTGDYVVYNICYYNCNGSNLSSVADTAGKVYLNLSKGAERSAEAKYFEHPFVINGKPLLISTSQYFDAELTANGTYNGSKIAASDIGRMEEYSTTFYNGQTYGSTRFLTSKKLENHISPYLNTTQNGESTYVFNSGTIRGKTAGQYYIGKPIVASQIATQLSLGQTYQFSGRSYYGSNVNIAVNFQKANWNGNWGANKLHNGFTAGGNITSSTLASNQLKGIGSAGNGFVTGGKVNATLVGVINGTDASKAGVIGNTIVNVQQSSGTQAVGDVFYAAQKR